MSKVCENCGKSLKRRQNKSGMERPNVFKRRRFCNRLCSGAYHHAAKLERVKAPVCRWCLEPIPYQTWDSGHYDQHWQDRSCCCNLHKILWLNERRGYKVTAKRPVCVSCRDNPATTLITRGDKHMKVCAGCAELDRQLKAIKPPQLEIRRRWQYAEVA